MTSLEHAQEKIDQAWAMEPGVERDNVVCQALMALLQVCQDQQHQLNELPYATFKG